MLSDEFYRYREVIYALIIYINSNNCDINKIYTIQNQRDHENSEM
jgi:hypothetical protein